MTKIVKNGVPTHFITDNDVLITNINHSGETLDEVVDNVEDTLDKHQKEIDKLKSNLKYVYSYGGVGGKGSGGSGGGGSTGDAKLYVSLGGHQITGDSNSSIILNGPGTYTIEMSVSNSGGKTFYVNVDTIENIAYSRPLSLSIEENKARRTKQITLSDNGTIVVQFFDAELLPLSSMEQSFIVNPHEFDMKFKYEFDNGSGDIQDIEFSPYEYFMGDPSYQNPFIDAYFKISLTGATNISLTYSIGDTDIIDEEGEYITGQGIKQFDTQDISNSHFKIHLNKLKRNGVKFTNEVNTGTYTITMTLNYTINGVPVDPDTRTFSITMIPSYLYINVRNPQNVLYDSLEELLADKVDNVPTKKLNVGVYTSFYCKIFEGPMKTTAQRYTLYLKSYSEYTGSEEEHDPFNTEPDLSPNEEKPGVVEQVETAKPISVAFSKPGIKKLVFSTFGQKSEVIGETVKYVYIIEAKSQVGWYPETIVHNNYYFMANKGDDTYSTYLNEQTFPTLPSNDEPLEISVSDNPVTISNIRWESPTQNYDTTILSFGMQYSSVNHDGATILETYNEATALYPDIKLRSNRLFAENSKQICIPSETKYDKANNSQYHLIQIVRYKVGYINVSTPQYATYLYIDGKLESNDPSIYRNQLYVGKIVLNNVNVVYNLINLQYVNINQTSAYTLDGLIYQYYLAYKENMSVGTISTAEMTIFRSLQNMKFDGENTIVDISFVNTVSPFMPIPTMMMEYEGSSDADRSKFITDLFAGYNNGASNLFGQKSIKLHWCNPERDNEIKEITVQNIRDKKTNELYNGDWLVELQGTSTMRNKIKNFSLIVNTRDATGNKKLLMSPNYDPNDKTTFLPERIWTLKADIADSAHANNTSVGKFVNRACSPFSSGLALNPSISGYIKNTLEGFPILMYFKVGTDVYYLGVYNFNMGRNSYYNLGYHSNEDILEMVSNIPDSQSSSFTFSIGSDILIDGLAIGEIQENHAEFDFHQYDESVLFTPENTSRDTMFGGASKITGADPGITRRRISDFVKSVATAGAFCFANIGKIPVPSKDDSGNCITRYDAVANEPDENGNITYNAYVPDISWEMYYDSNGNKAWRENPNTKFDVLGLDIENLLQCISSNDAEGEPRDNYLYLDFTSASEYYTICMAFGLVDSILKNMNVKAWNGKKFYIAFYDMDCAMGEDNAGDEDVSYLAATDYWHSDIINGYLSKATINYDYWDERVCKGKGFDFPSSYLFAIAKYAQAILEKRKLSSVTLKNYPQQFWAELRRPYINEEHPGGELQNVDYFIEKYFSSGIGKVPAYLATLNYRVKYLYYGSILDDKGLPTEATFDTNQSAFNGTRLEKVKDWLTKRIHFLDIVFNVYGLDKEIGGGYSMPKPDDDIILELRQNPDIVITSDVFTSGNLNAALSSSLGTPVSIYAPLNTPIIILRGSFSDIYLLSAGTDVPNPIKIVATAKETLSVLGSTAFTDLSIVDPFLTNSYSIQSNQLERINYSGADDYTEITNDLTITSTSVKEIKLDIPTWKGILNIVTTGQLNGQAVHTINVSRSGFTGTWNGLKNLKNLNISSVTDVQGTISVSDCPFLTGENCIISGTESKPTVLNTLDLLGVSGDFSLENTQIINITMSATSKKNATFTIYNDPSLRKLSLTGFKEIVISGCPNLEKVTITDTDDNKCEKLIIDIPESNDRIYHLSSFNSETEGVFDFTKYSELKVLGLSGSEAEVIKIPNRKVSVTTFRDNVNLEFVDTYGQNSCIELTKSGTFNNCPHYGMRQSWYAGTDSNTDTVIKTDGTYEVDRYTKMSISDGTNGQDVCTILSHTFNKLDANDKSNHLTNAKAYTNEWGQKVKNKSIIMSDTAYFINTVVGGGKIDNAWIYSVIDPETEQKVYMVHNTAKNEDQVRFGSDCRANITSFANCFYKQKDVTYDYTAAFDTPDFSGYTSLNDISRMYYGTSVSYISAALLSLPFDKNTSAEENVLDWTEFIGSGEIKMARNALMNISYRIESISLIQPSVYDETSTQRLLNVDKGDGYLDILSILCPVKSDGSNVVRNLRGKVTNVTYNPADINDYVKFTRIKMISNFYVNVTQYVDYSNLFTLCNKVETISNFLNCDLSKAKIDGMMKDCTTITSIIESFNHSGDVSDLPYEIDLYDFFNWGHLQNISALFECSGDDAKKIGFGIKKTISNSDFFTILGELPDYTKIKRLSNIFAFCTITEYDGTEIKLNDDMLGVTNINALFYHCSGKNSLGNDVPLKIRRSFFEHLPNVTLMANTFCGVHFDHMLSYDFFCKQIERNDNTIYTKVGDNYVGAVLHTISYNTNYLINSMYNCFKDAKFVGCRCWFDVNKDFDVADRHIPFRDVVNNDSTITTYYRKEGGVYVPYEIKEPTAYSDTLNNFTNYVNSIRLPGNNYDINNHDIKADLVTFDNIPSNVDWTVDNNVPFVENTFDIYPTYCCLPPDIFYGCYRECDLTNVFSNTNIIGVIPQHLLIKCYNSNINNMFENVNILPNIIYQYNTSFASDQDYLDMIDDIDVDNDTINVRTGADQIVCELDTNSEAIVLFRNSDGELKRRKPILSIHNDGDPTPLTDDRYVDYKKSQFVYVPQGYVTNTSLQEAFTFRYNLPNQVDMYRSDLATKGITWPTNTNSFGNDYSPENKPALWPYHTQYFFMSEESVKWNTLKNMSKSFISDGQDISFEKSEPRLFSTDNQDYTNRWWNSRSEIISPDAWHDYTSGVFNVFLDLCCIRNVRTGKVNDYGCALSNSMRNYPNVEQFVSGILTIFLNGRIFNDALDGAEFTSRNGSPIVQYSYGFGKNILLPMFNNCTNPLQDHPKVILTYPPEKGYFYNFMFLNSTSKNNYVGLYSIPAGKLKDTGKYILLS